MNNNFWYTVRARLSWTVGDFFRRWSRFQHFLLILRVSCSLSSVMIATIWNTHRVVMLKMHIVNLRQVVLCCAINVHDNREWRACRDIGFALRRPFCYQNVCLWPEGWAFVFLPHRSSCTWSQRSAWTRDRCVSIDHFIGVSWYEWQ